MHSSPSCPAHRFPLQYACRVCKRLDEGAGLTDDAPVSSGAARRPVLPRSRKRRSQMKSAPPGRFLFCRQEMGRRPQTKLRRLHEPRERFTTSPSDAEASIIVLLPR